MWGVSTLVLLRARSLPGKALVGPVVQISLLI
jgi:hypothetical protein